MMLYYMMNQGGKYNKMGMNPFMMSQLLNNNCVEDDDNCVHPNLDLGVACGRGGESATPPFEVCCKCTGVADY